MATQCFVWDLVVKAESNHKDKVVNFMKEWGKKWVFQLEEGDTGYVHWQCRLSLKKKRREGELAKAIRDGGWLVDFRISPVVKSNVDDWSYADKADTRKEGPWSSEDPVPPYIPRQIREIKELYPWQKSVVEQLKIWDKRKINIIVCKEGNKGKSVLVGWCRAYGLARPLPMCNDYRDIMRMAHSLPEARAYIIDMPRAIAKDKLFQFYSGIETLKDGYCYDDRYTFRERNFDCPNIWVFSNLTPDPTLLSNDRWNIWTIDERFELTQYRETSNNKRQRRE